MTDKFYSIAEGAELPADIREDLARELDFAAAADTLAEIKAQTLDLALTALARARAEVEAAREGIELAERAKATADRRVLDVMTRGGLTRTAEGIR